MIVAADEIVFVLPVDIENLKESHIHIIRRYFETDQVFFIITKKLKSTVEHEDDSQKNLLMESYKVGMLRLFLGRIYPEKNNSFYFKTIREYFQVFSKDRTLQARMTTFKKEIERFSNM